MIKGTSHICLHFVPICATWVITKVQGFITLMWVITLEEELTFSKHRELVILNFLLWAQLAPVREATIG